MYPGLLSAALRGMFVWGLSEFILIQSCFPTPKFAWTAVQTVKNDGIDPISLLTRCDMDNWWSCVAQCAKRKLKYRDVPLSHHWQTHPGPSGSSKPAEQRLVAQGSDEITAPAPHVTSHPWCSSQRCVLLAPGKSASGFFSNLLAWESSSCHPFTFYEGERRPKKEKRMKNESKRRRNTLLATAGDLKCPYKHPAFWGASVSAGRAGSGRKGKKSHYNENSL